MSQGEQIGTSPLNVKQIGVAKPLGTNLTVGGISQTKPRRRRSTALPPADYASLFQKLVPSGGAIGSHAATGTERLHLRDILSYVQNPPPNPGENPFLQMIKTHRIQTTVDDAHQLGSTPYWSQGDMSLHTSDMLKRRIALRNNPLILAETAKYWEVCDLVPGQDAITRDEYSGILQRLSKTLLADYSQTETAKIARDGWNEFTVGARYMRYETFHESLFEIVDIWCATVNALDYAGVLRRLFYAITSEPPDVEWKKLEDVSLTASLSPGSGDSRRVFPEMAGDKCPAPLQDLLPFFVAEGEKIVAILISDTVRTIGDLSASSSSQVRSLLAGPYPLLHIEIALTGYYYGPFFAEQDRQAAIELARQDAEREAQERAEEMARRKEERIRKEEEARLAKEQESVERKAARQREREAEAQERKMRHQSHAAGQGSTSTSAMRARQAKKDAHTAYLQAAGIMDDLGDDTLDSMLFEPLERSTDLIEDLLPLLPSDDGYRGTFYAKHIQEIGQLSQLPLLVIQDFPQINNIRVLRAALARYSARRGHYDTIEANTVLYEPLQYCELTIRPISSELGLEWSEILAAEGLTTIGGLASLKCGYVATFPIRPDPVATAYEVLDGYYLLHSKYSNAVMLGLPNDDHLQLFPLLADCDYPISDFLDTLMSFHDQWISVFAEANIGTVKDLCRTPRGEVRKWNGPKELRHGPVSYLESALHTYYRHYQDNLYTVTPIVTGTHLVKPISMPSLLPKSPLASPRDTARFVQVRGSPTHGMLSPRKIAPSVSGFFPDSYDNQNTQQPVDPQAVADDKVVSVHSESWRPDVALSARIVVGAGTTALQSRLINLQGALSVSRSELQAPATSTEPKTVVGTAKIYGPHAHSPSDIGHQGTALTSSLKTQMGAWTQKTGAIAAQVVNRDVTGKVQGRVDDAEARQANRFFPSRIRRANDLPQSRSLHEADAIESAEAEIFALQYSLEHPDKPKPTFMKKAFKKPPVIDVTEPAHLLHVKTLVEKLTMGQSTDTTHEKSPTRRRPRSALVRPDIQGAFVGGPKRGTGQVKESDSRSSVRSTLPLRKQTRPRVDIGDEDFPGNPSRQSAAHGLNSAMDIVFDQENLLDDMNQDEGRSLLKYGEHETDLDFLASTPSDPNRGRQVSLLMDIPRLGDPPSGVRDRKLRPRTATHAKQRKVRPGSARGMTRPSTAQGPIRKAVSAASVNHSPSDTSRPLTSHTGSRGRDVHRRPATACATNSAFGRTLSSENLGKHAAMPREDSWASLAPPDEFKGLVPQGPHRPKGKPRRRVASARAKLGRVRSRKQ